MACNSFSLRTTLRGVFRSIVRTSVLTTSATHRNRRSPRLRFEQQQPKIPVPRAHLRVVQGKRRGSKNDGCTRQVQSIAGSCWLPLTQQTCVELRLSAFDRLLTSAGNLLPARRVAMSGEQPDRRAQWKFLRPTSRSCAARQNRDQSKKCRPSCTSARHSPEPRWNLRL